MYQWRALLSKGLYRIVFAGSCLVTLYLLFNIPSGTGAGMVNDKVAHAVTFFFLTLFLSRSMPERYGIKAVLIMCLFGLLTEVVQYFLPWRSFSLADWIADIVGVLCYHCLHLIRRRFVEVIRGDDYVQN